MWFWQLYTVASFPDIYFTIASVTGATHITTHYYSSKTFFGCKLQLLWAHWRSRRDWTCIALQWVGVYMCLSVSPGIIILTLNQQHNPPWTSPKLSIVLFFEIKRYLILKSRQSKVLALATSGSETGKRYWDFNQSPDWKKSKKAENAVIMTQLCYSTPKTVYKSGCTFDLPSGRAP